MWDETNQRIIRRPWIRRRCRFHFDGIHFLQQRDCGIESLFVECVKVLFERGPEERMVIVKHEEDVYPECIFFALRETDGTVEESKVGR